MYSGPVPHYTAVSYGVAVLECTSDTWVNPDWKPNMGGGINYSTKTDNCKGADLNMNLRSISKTQALTFDI